MLAANPKLAEILNEYSNEGLRTLVIAKKVLDVACCHQHYLTSSENLKRKAKPWQVLDEAEWAEWDRVHAAAAAALVNREEALMEAAEQIEVDMEPLGVTAIEDKLQLGLFLFF